MVTRVTVILLAIDTDLTSQFSTLAKVDNWINAINSGVFTYAGWAAPQVTVNGGQVALIESYVGVQADKLKTGEVMYQEITGLAPGTYAIELFGAACYTPNRNDMTQDFEEGDAQSQKAVYLYAQSGKQTVKEYIACLVEDNMNNRGGEEAIPTAKLEGIVVGEDGTIKMGIFKELGLTNWHFVQLKRVIAQVNAYDLLASLKEQAAELLSKQMSIETKENLAESNEMEIDDLTEDNAKDLLDTFMADIDAAEKSAEAYAAIAEAVDANKQRVLILDETGQQTADFTWIEEMLASGTISDDEVTVQDYINNIIPDIYISAVKAQNTIGADITDASQGQPWEDETGWWYLNDVNYRWRYDLPFVGNVMTQTITGLLPERQYAVTLRAAAYYDAESGFDGVQDGLTCLFVADRLVNIPVTLHPGNENMAVNDEYTIVGITDGEGTLTYGMRNLQECASMHLISLMSITYQGEPVAPTAITIMNGDVDVTDGTVNLDGNTPSVTLTLQYTPEEAAPGYVNWTSSNEEVATVDANGVVKAIANGTATITVTSTLDESISASCTVVMSLPSPELLNPSFELSAADTELTGVQKTTAPNALAIYGWTQSGQGPSFNDTQIMNAATENASAFGKKVSPTDGNYYLYFREGWNGSSTADVLFTANAVTLPAGKYTVTYDYMLAESTDNSHTSKGTTLTLKAINGDATIESAVVSAALNPGNTYFTNADNWKTVTMSFLLDEEAEVKLQLALTPRGGVRSDMCVDNFKIAYASCKMVLGEAIAEMQDNIDNIVNVGDKPFQRPKEALKTLQTALTQAKNVYDNGTDADALTETDALKTAYNEFLDTDLNDPQWTPISIVNVSEGYNHKGKALTFKSAKDADLSKNTTSMGWSEYLGSIYPQNVMFAKVTGEKNTYTLSYFRADGSEVYVGTGSSTGLGNANTQIRPTTDSSKALKVRVEASDKEGVWYLWNTEANFRLGANGANDQGFFTGEVNGYKYYDMQLQDAGQQMCEVYFGIDADVKYGTIILPFTFGSDAFTAYTVSGVVDEVLTLDEVDQSEGPLLPNTPYIIFAENGYDMWWAGHGSAYTDPTYTEGLLTGTYDDIDAPNGSYVLQNHDGTVAFWRVDTSVAMPIVPANHAYLTAPASNDGARVFRLNGEATAISTLKALTCGEAEIYDMNGRRLVKLQKGVNIIRTKDGQTRKVMVK